MEQTLSALMLAAAATVPTSIPRLRHRLPSWPRMGLPTLVGVNVRQGASAAGVWGYHRLARDMHSDRDIEAIFFRRKTLL